MSVIRDAVGELYRELGPGLLAYARTILDDPAEAEDAVQHVFLKLIAGQPTVCREPRAYLFRAVRNQCINHRRDAAREALRTAGPPPGLDAVVADLETALGELPEEQREVVMLRIWGGMTLEPPSSARRHPSISTRPTSP
jgi:RNA polymerase sigma-70 factor (ECF subfamily)